MINVITDIIDKDEQYAVQMKVGNLNHICICKNCGALIQFDNNDINRERMLPHIMCPCGKSVQLHSKYSK